jgi:adenosylcobinamide-phosphate synthase
VLDRRERLKVSAVEEVFYYLPLVIVSAYLLDLMVGDPEFLPHPVRWIGRLINFLEGKLGRLARAERLAGGVLTLVVLTSVFGLTWGILELASALSTALFLLVSLYLGWSVLSVKSLKKEAQGVIEPLRKDELKTARHRLSRIVGRDTGELTRRDVMKAVVETVSENTSDGIVAPLFYLALGGPVLAVTYKAVNTLDSMVGYRNRRYFNLGWFSARLDDWANYIPARITAALMVVSSYFLGLDSKGSLSVLKNYGRSHPSPNAGLPQAAVAGALGIRLGGPASYFGTVHEKPYIGQGTAEIEERTVEATLEVMRLTAVFMLLLTLLFHMALQRMIFG